MAIFVEFFPIIIFFILYKIYGIYIATIAAIVTSLLYSLFAFIKYKRINKMQIVTLLLLIVLGGLTVIYHNEQFIKWKPTAVNWLFAIAFLMSHFFRNGPLAKMLIGKSIMLPTRLWHKLNLTWVGFFILMGLANLYVMYHFDTNTWVNFKLFGSLGITLLFVIAQGFYLSKHIETKS